MNAILLNTNYANVLLSSLRISTSKIYIMSYVISGNQCRASDPITQLINILAVKVRRGLDVRVILDNPKRNRPNFNANRVYMRQLSDNNIPFCLNAYKTTAHAKAVLIDDEKLFIGSHNLAHRSLQNPLEFSVMLEDKYLAVTFNHMFLNFWNDPMYYRFPPNELIIDRIYP
jgi:phosphatidylserine/phosphatidylglycerophosphate/cardiolipin synthase-like enzyme